MGNIIKPGHGPEWYIQREIKQYLTDRGCLVEHTHGSLYQTGFPDLLVKHPDWPQKWVDSKVPGKYSFTRDQRRKWPIWDAFGIPIWIMTAGNQEQYDLLFKPPNWKQYWKKSWGPIPDIKTLLDHGLLLDQILADWDDDEEEWQITEA